MRRYLLIVVIASLQFAGERAMAQQPAEIRYTAVADFLKLPPDVYFGEVAGVAVNSKGHVFVFSRGNSTGPAYGASAAQLLEFDAKGKFLREIGHNLYAWSYAHTVKVDPEDNIWVTDKGSDMVIKFNPAGRVVMVFGRKQEASDEGHWAAEACAAAAAAGRRDVPAGDRRGVGCAGNTFISDGYINSRVAKVDKDGNWIKSWGEPGDGPGQFNVPHSIATDAQGNVYVADRGNRRIQVFDGDGKFLRQMTIDVPAPADARPAIGNKPTATTGTMAPGAPWAICITPGPHQVLYSVGRVSGANLQAESRRKSAWDAWESGKQPEAVRMDSRNCVPVGKRAVRGGALELARAEINS